MVDVISEQPVRPLIGRLVVVGLGLIGGSFAKGVRESGLCREVVGVDLDPRSRELAVELGVVDRCEADLALACCGADVIQLAVPILAMEKLLALLAPLDLGGAILTDVGSAKGNVVRAARQAFGQMPSRFVPGHPIAGSEQSGVEASNAALFRRHKVILTPLAETDPHAVAVVDQLWSALGADVEHMQVERHDEVLAATSHLPHLLAFGLVDSLAKRNENLEIFRYAAGGFRDFTRIAGSDPTMWHDIFMANREAVLRTLDTFRSDLDALRDAVDAGDGPQLLDVFTRARAAREHFGRILASRVRVDAAPGDQRNAAVRSGDGVSHRIKGPIDVTSSVLFMVATSISEGCDLLLEDVGVSPACEGAIDVLRLMGGDIALQNVRATAGGTLADLHVRSARLKGVDVPEALVPLAIDTFPVLLVAAACAEGRTILRGAQALQAEQAECVRLMADGLLTLGIEAEPVLDGIIIEGGTPDGGEVDARGDQRIVMAFRVASLRASAPIRIQNCADAATVFPHFLALCAQVGMRVAQEDKK
ncbi:prephenate dehydrogenase/arogenate dehydrogenase family protein [Pseudomonas tremae]|uniref:prephenate dehydrogenase/arogenate dehydrogenase family protein n=1 Tax=Pseudomonas syringae group TaxID=136849 RepID=UPI0006D5D14D|nr:prephenate dehydrogenase/arogenate dehydrogenase family protein [Pseudomonas coronafaciens]MCQ3025878.1 prephenate dehydrogenase/arogenate dehydrogenase family protein [Pseudomonas tremae]RMS92820.1 Prephenate dehydrogenase/3-phosphoshikimate 1-carboxyvinyltransferase protein [Pseudomonas coronafaciens pv. oryzae]RMS93458.1 Prephenate dehydrogenase/3-phosphoshikimate 1-carboxyvinyltransferase protein [Pseudomonas coronafaciens pv. oryzae]RMV85393.1 Prephenate dehydrogenase/3-phosphoshikimate